MVYIIFEVTNYWLVVQLCANSLNLIEKTYKVSKTNVSYLAPRIIFKVSVQTVLNN